MTKLIAYYYPSRHGASLELYKLEDNRRSHFSSHNIDGKRSARVIAAALGAEPFNF